MSKVNTSEQFKEYLDQYFGVIELARKVSMYYCGTLDGQPKICSDVVGEMIAELRNADSKGKLIRTDEETLFNDVDHKLTPEQQKKLDDLVQSIKEVTSGRK